MPAKLAAREPAEALNLPLHEAVERGWVSVQVSGRGYASGDSIRVDVRRICDHPLNVTVAVGTVAKPVNADVQSMALARVKFVLDGREWVTAQSMALHDKETRKFLVEGYCRDRAKPAPTRDSRFAIYGPDESNTVVLVRAGGVEATVKITQAALWIQREQMNPEQARQQFGGGLSEPEVDVAIRLAANQPLDADFGIAPASAVGVGVVNGGNVNVGVQLSAIRDAVRKIRQNAEATGNRRADRGSDRPQGRRQQHQQSEPAQRAENRPLGRVLRRVGEGVRQVQQVKVAVPILDADDDNVGEAVDKGSFQLRIGQIKGVFDR
jgi:hypothetical protein